MQTLTFNFTVSCNVLIQPYLKVRRFELARKHGYLTVQVRIRTRIRLKSTRARAMRVVALLLVSVPVAPNQEHDSDFTKIDLT